MARPDVQGGKVGLNKKEAISATDDAIDCESKTVCKSSNDSNTCTYRQHIVVYYQSGIYDLVIKYDDLLYSGLR